MEMTNIESNRAAYTLEVLIHKLGIAEDVSKMEVKEQLVNGVYSRELFIKGEDVVIGKTHSTTVMNIILKGRCTICLGTNVQEYSTGDYFISTPYSKKIIMAIEDTVLLNVVNVPCDNIEDVLDYITVNEGEV